MDSYALGYTSKTSRSFTLGTQHIQFKPKASPVIIKDASQEEPPKETTPADAPSSSEETNTETEDEEESQGAGV